MNSKICNVFEKLSKLCKGIIAVLIMFIMAYLATNSILGTTTLTEQNGSKQYLLYSYDNIILTLLFIVAVCVIIYTIFNDIFEKINPKIFSIVLSVYVLALGIFWVCSAKSLPTSDAERIVNFALEFSNGNYSAMDDMYLYKYPFQLGYVLLCQIVVSIFKDDCYLALEILNVIGLVVTYLGLIKITDYLFNNRRLTNMTIFMFMFSFQAIIMTTFIYGILTSLALVVWAIYFAIKYIRTDKKSNIVVSSILLGISIVLKPNNMIVMVAICVVLLLKFLDTRKVFDIVSVVICVVLGVSLSNVVVAGYEAKSNIDLGDGMPKILWVNMGLHESYINNGYGWYNPKYGGKIFQDSELDGEESSKVAKEQILEQIEYFKSNPDYANTFFSEKILSTWNEPTFQSIFRSKYQEHWDDIGQFAEDIYNGDKGSLALFIMNQYQQIVYLFAFVCLCMLFKKKDVSLYIIPLVVLGGFLYHLIFETKSQYALSYFILLVPMASYGITQLLSSKSLRRLKRHLKACATK